jgi:hypothetical protein
MKHNTQHAGCLASAVWPAQPVLTDLLRQYSGHSPLEAGWISAEAQGIEACMSKITPLCQRAAPNWLPVPPCCHPQPGHRTKVACHAAVQVAGWVDVGQPCGAGCCASHLGPGLAGPGAHDGGGRLQEHGHRDCVLRPGAKRWLSVPKIVVSTRTGGLQASISLPDARIGLRVYREWQSGNETAGLGRHCNALLALVGAPQYS